MSYNIELVERVGRAGSHYTINRVTGDGMAFLREHLRNGCNQMNWLILSTSGVHGSYTTLDEIENDPETAQYGVTWQLLAPRMVRIYYGNTEPLTSEDIVWLRERVAETLKAVAQSQTGNTP